MESALTSIRNREDTRPWAKSGDKSSSKPMTHPSTIGVYSKVAKDGSASALVNASGAKKRSRKVR